MSASKSTWFAGEELTGAGEDLRSFQFEHPLSSLCSATGPKLCCPRLLCLSLMLGRLADLALIRKQDRDPAAAASVQM